MFKNTYQNGLLSIFYSCGSAPLALWDLEVHNGHIKRVTDNEVNSIVLEVVSTNVAVTYITCPKNSKTLGIKLPFLVMIVKNLKRYFSFEITVLDDKNMRRRFKISNFQSTTKIKPFCTTMPIGLAGGWNQIQFNLSDFTRRAYGSQYVETLRVQINANVRIRRIYFSDRLYTEEELPQDYKLYMPLTKRDRREKKEVSKPEAPKKPQKKEKETKEKVSPAETPKSEIEPTSTEGKRQSEEARKVPEKEGGNEIGPEGEDKNISGEIPGEGEATAKPSAEQLSVKSGEVSPTKGYREEGASLNAEQIDLDVTTEGSTPADATMDLEDEDNDVL